jgi:hypothetical protein
MSYRQQHLYLPVFTETVSFATGVMLIFCISAATPGYPGTDVRKLAS